MKRAWLVAAAVVWCGGAAFGQPKAPAGYTVEEYLKIPGACNPLGMGFSPPNSRLWAGQLIVCFGNDESGAATRSVYRVTEKGKGELIGRPSDCHAGLGVPPPGSEFGDRLYAAMGNQVVSYGADNKQTVFCTLGRNQLYTVRFGPGGAWTRDLYLLDNCDSSGTLHRIDSKGNARPVVSGLPMHSMGFDFGPGGPWGTDAYLGLSGTGIYRLNPKGEVTPFVKAQDMPPAGWLAGFTFDPTGDFGGRLFYSSLGDGRIMQVDPNGGISEFASGFNFGGDNQSTGRIVFGPDGAMYVGDGMNNVVWRIARPRLRLVREAEADVLVAADDKTARGTVLNERFSLETTLGRLDLPARQVLGMVDDGNGLKCLLSDGQIVAGRLLSGPIRLAAADGKQEPAEFKTFRQWGRKISSEYPAGTPPAGPLVVMRDGQEVLIDANGTEVRLAGPWGEVSVDLSEITLLVSVSEGGLGTPSGPGTSARDGNEPSAGVASFRLHLRSGSVLVGRLAAGLVLRPRLGGRWNLDAARLARIRTGLPEEPAPWWTRVQLAGGEVAVGCLRGDGIAIRTADGVVETDANEVRELAAVPEMPGGVRLKRWDGSSVAGLVEKGEVRFLLRPGPEIHVPASRIVSLACPVRGPAEEFAAKLSGTIARLGADSYRERETATQELVRMGAVIIPMLEKFANDSDPEVRQRVQLVLGLLRGGASPAPRREVRPGPPAPIGAEVGGRGPVLIGRGSG